MYDALTNPPVPHWDDLSDEDKEDIEKAWRMYSCPHSCGGDVFYVYIAIREMLRNRELRYLRATMAG